MLRTYLPQSPVMSEFDNKVCRVDRNRNGQLGKIVWLPLSDDASTTKQMNDYGNYRQDQQNVYEPGRNVKRKKSQKPEHDENRCEYR